MQEINISQILAEKIPAVELSCIQCDVVVEKKNEQLWNEILDKIKDINQVLKTEQISKLPAIASSRKAYKACGKDPARYRLSAEALLRRVLKRKEIYQVNNVVDVLNLVSISTGFSIGGYDADTIKGAISFGIGKKDEPYTGIGRGELNIEGMPVFRDDIGGFGTPTSDSVRTCVSENTRRFLMVIIDYGSISKLEDASEMAVGLLEKYASATHFEIKIIKI